MTVGVPTHSITEPANPPEKRTVHLDDGGAGADVRAVMIWTLVSRISGFARVAVLAAVLGPTFFGNLFLTALAIPGAMLDLFLGTMIAMLLVPALVRHLDVGDLVGARRLANGLLGVLVLLTTLLVAAVLLAGGVILDLITAAVADPAVREQQRLLGWPLLVILMPQIVLHVLVAVAIAVQNANRRFALPAGAPAIENVGIVAVLVVSAWLFGVGGDLEDVSMAQLLLLALGSTGAVALHAAVQWWGARAVGFALWPKPAWRDPELRRIFRLAAPSSCNTLLSTATWLGLLIAAGSLPGGAVALQIGYSLFNLPIALGARPVAIAQLPRLSRSALEHDGREFQSLYRASIAMARFVVLPACLVFLVMPETLAHAVSFGRMADAAGIAMVAAVILGLGVGLLGEAVTVLGTAAAYARQDAVTPLQAMALRAVAMAAGIAVALGAMSGAAVLLTLCLALSVGNLAAAAHLHRRLLGDRPAGARAAAESFVGDFAAAVVAVLPAAIAAHLLAAGAESMHERFAIAILCLGGAGLLYLLLQHLRGAPTLVELLGRRPAAATATIAASEPRC